MQHLVIAFTFRRWVRVRQTVRSGPGFAFLSSGFQASYNKGSAAVGKKRRVFISDWLTSLTAGRVYSQITKEEKEERRRDREEETQRGMSGPGCV